MHNCLQKTQHSLKISHSNGQTISNSVLKLTKQKNEYRSAVQLAKQVTTLSNVALISS